MPSQITHLAIAKKYLEKHARLIKDVQRFLDGNVLPDLTTNKAISHYGTRTEARSILKYNREKVNANKFLREHDMSDDLNKGQYLHLIVDEKYYNEFLLNYFQKCVDSKQAQIDMYEVSRRDDVYIRERYGVGYSDSSFGDELKRINHAWDEEYLGKRRQIGYKFVFPYKVGKIDKFIEEMANIDIPLN